MSDTSKGRFRPSDSLSARSLKRVALVAAFGLAAMPAAALAQDTISVKAQQVPGGLNEAVLSGKVAAKFPTPVADPRLVPVGSLLQHNALPAGTAALAGATAGSSDGATGTSGSTRPNAYGNGSPESIAPYTTARSSATVLGPTPNADALGITSYPWRAAGLLLFSEPSGTYQCSASMISPGLVVTAAHCVYPFGANSGSAFYTNETFYPAVYDNTAPYGAYRAASITIATAYFNGTDYCAQRGVVCNDDLAIISLASNAGARVGWYGYGWNGYSFVSSFGGASLASITQLGYPGAFDGGRQQERTDGIGSFWGPGSLKNTLLGTAQTAGSSGGPWLVNFGARPNVTSGATLGKASASNVVDGVTSWLYTTVGINTGGASWFGQDLSFPGASYVDSHGIARGAGNIGALVAAACSLTPGAC